MDKCTTPWDPGEDIQLNSFQNEKYFRQDVQNIKTHILYSVTFSEIRAIYEVMWKIIVELDRPKMTI